MALATVEGVYRDGVVELSEPPEGVRESPVLVAFLVAPSENERAGLERADAEDREAARQPALARMRAGIPLGGPPYPSREELHDRGNQ